MLIVGFGSQTGTAQRIAGEITQTCKDKGVPVSMMCLNQVHEVPAGAVLLVVTSTFGDGSAPMNAAQFTLPKGVSRYAVLGIGNSLYPKFCAFSKDLDALLGAVAVSVLPRLDADSIDPTQLEVTVSHWTDSFFRALSYMETVEDIEDLIMPSCTHSKCVACSGSCVEMTQADCSWAETLFPDSISAKVADARYIVEGDYRVIHMELEIPESEYMPGDIVSVPCKNDSALVSSLLERLQVDSSQTFPLPSQYHKVPTHASASFILSCCCDISSPSFAVYALLADSCDSETESENLLCLSKSQTQYSLLTLLLLHPSSQPDFQALIILLPPLSPRLYSIASSSSQSVELVFSVAETVLPDNSVHKGVCSSWLEETLTEYKSNAHACLQIPVYLSPSGDIFNIKGDVSHVLMIGAGTGCVPFRSYLQHVSESNTSNVSRHLFLGFRHPSRDYIFEEDWNEYHKLGLVEQLHVSFSQLPGAPHRYVQHSLQSQSGTVLKALTTASVHDRVLICGRIRLWDSVKGTFLDILQQSGGLTKADALSRLDQLVQCQVIQLQLYG